MKLTHFQIQGQEHPTFRGVQVLRGFAAAMVVALHATQYWSQRVGGQAPSLVWGNGAAGVDIFFVISGFVMAVSTIGREDNYHPARDFLKRRLIRIVPLYWIATTLVLLKDVFIFRNPNFANSAEHPRTPLSYIVSSFLFIPYRNSLGHVEPLLNVGWTLSFEMLFYLLFASALALRVRVAIWLTPVMIGLVITGIFANLFNGLHAPAICTLANPILLEFLAGLVLGKLVLSGHRFNLALSSLLGTLGLIVLVLIPWILEPRIRALEWGLPATMVVVAVVMLEKDFGYLWPRWALKLGDASYSLYLFHLLLLAGVAKVLAKTPFDTSGRIRRTDEVATIIVVLCLCVPAALLLYQFIELPITNWLKRRLTSSRTFRSA